MDMQDNYWGRRVTISEFEKMRLLRNLKVTMQKKLTEAELDQDTDPLEILFIKDRIKSVQKALVKFEDNLISIELGIQ